MDGLVPVAFLIVFSVWAHVRYIVATQPEIAIFQEFDDFVGLTSSTATAASVSDPELKLIDFI